MAEEEKPETKEPTPEEIAAARSADAFGLDKGPKADPGDKKVEKKPDPESATTETAGKDGQKPGDEKLYAGRYKTVEALEIGTIEKEKLISKIENENKQLRDELGRFKAPATKAEDKKEADKAAAAQDDDDPDLKLLKDNLGEDLTNSLLRVATKIVGKEVEPFKADREQASIKDFIAEMAKDIPGQDPAELDAMFQEVAADLEAASSDPAKQRRLLVDIMKGRGFAGFVDKALAARAKAGEEADKARKVAAGTVTGEGTGAGKGNPGEGLSDARKRSLNAFGLLEA